METLEKFTFDIHFQNGILKRMLQEDTFAFNCIKHIQPEHFENKYQAWLFKKISQYMERFKEIPTKHFLIDQLKTISLEEVESYKKGLINILSTELKDISYLKEELTEFIKNREYKKLHTNCAKLFNDGKFNEAYRINEEMITKIRNTSFSDDSYIKPEDIDNILTKSKNSSKVRIPTGITIIDEKLRGGLSKKTVSTIIAASNAGKTTSAINLAYYAALSGNKVLFLFHEGTKEEIVLKFLSRITKIHFDQLESGDLTEEDRVKIEEAKVFIGKFIRIKEMRFVGVTVEDVYAYSKSVKKEWGFDLLIDDYGGILKSTKVNYKEKRQTLGHIWETFNLISAELDIAIVTIAQFNREAIKKNREGKAVLRSDNVSEAADIIFHSDTILTIMRSPQDILDQNLTVCLDKSRRTQAGLLVKCRSDFRTMRAWDSKLGVQDAGWDNGTA